MLKIALADDQTLVLHGLRALLESVEGIEVSIAEEDGDLLLDALRRQTVDVVVSDIRMARCSGLDLTRALRERGDLTPVLLLTTFDDPGLLRAAVDAGAQGFMLKDSTPEILKATIERLAAGNTLLEPVSLSHVNTRQTEDVHTASQLTPREISILRLIAGGFSNKEIGRTLAISPGTVKNRVTDIMLKLEARDRTHAVIKAISARLM